VSAFDEIILPDEQLEVLEATRQTTFKLWVARQVCMNLKQLLRTRIEGPQIIDKGTRV
jgi:hypothetical protein